MRKKLISKVCGMPIWLSTWLVKIDPNFAYLAKEITSTWEAFKSPSILLSPSNNINKSMWKGKWSMEKKNLILHTGIWTSLGNLIMWATLWRT